MLASLTYGATAYGAESMRFEPMQQSPLPQTIAGSVKNTNLLKGNIDLNGDSVDEVLYQAAPPLCSENEGCTYFVTAKKKDSWIVIGEFKGFNILISDKRTYGIRDIIVYNIPHNDFESVRYAWNPKRYQYEQKN